MNPRQIARLLLASLLLSPLGSVRAASGLQAEHEPRHYNGSFVGLSVGTSVTLPLPSSYLEGPGGELFAGLDPGERARRHRDRATRRTRVQPVASMEGGEP